MEASFSMLLTSSGLSKFGTPMNPRPPRLSSRQLMPRHLPTTSFFHVSSCPRPPAAPSIWRNARAPHRPPHWGSPVPKLSSHLGERCQGYLRALFSASSSYEFTIHPAGPRKRWKASSQLLPAVEAELGLEILLGPKYGLNMVKTG